ncbi:MAG TPA: hypothetical protein VLB27_04420, partial [candidate division Zixibacteria bacterium]|nr:hypothetical protein [candidate division Zixibacteria bacterium]
MRGATNKTLQIDGGNFTAEATVTSSCTALIIHSVSVVDESTIQATVSVAGDAVPGVCDMTVTTDAGSATCTECIAIRLPAPTISNVNPAAVRQGQVDLTLQITGQNFFAPISLEFGCTGVASGDVIVISATELQTTVTVAADAPTGACDVMVATEWGDATCPACLTVLASEQPPDGYDYTTHRTVTVIPHAPGREYGDDAVLHDARPLFDWDYSATGIAAENVRFKVHVFPVLPGQGTVSDIITNWPAFTIAGIDQPILEFPPYLDPLVMGEDYVWFVQAYDENDPAQTIIGTSEYYNFRIADIPELDTLPPTAHEPTDGEFITLVYPGRPCDESDPGRTYTSYGYGSVFRLILDPQIISVNIIEWFVPCGYVPVPEIVDQAVPAMIKGSVDPSGRTTSPVVVTASASDHNTVEVVIPSYAPPLIPGGAYVWTAMGTLSDGTQVSAGEYWCFRNGDLSRIEDAAASGVMPEDHRTAPVPREEPGTTTPEEPSTTGPGTSTQPPPTEGQPEPEPIPEEPGREPPPEVRCDQCQVTVYPEDCDVIRIEPIPPINPEDFDYPRAVPLLVIGDDADRIVTLCQNCGYSYEKKAVRDDIARYEWELDGKGSLNIPFPDPSAQNVLLDSLSSLLDSLRAELARVEARIKRIEQELPGLEADSASA